MILFGLTRESGTTVTPADFLAEGAYPGLQALGGALTPLLFDTGLLAAPYPKPFRRSAVGALRFSPQLQINEDVLFNIQFLQNTPAIYCLHGVYYKQYDTQTGSLSRRLRGDLLEAERITRPALAELLRANGMDPAPYERTSRLSLPRFWLTPMPAPPCGSGCSMTRTGCWPCRTAQVSPCSGRACWRRTRLQSSPFCRAAAASMI